jgi:N-acetylglutamate synthase-like GNAT family acetyltransferase
MREMDTIIRKAQQEDIKAIQQVAKRSWHDTYQGLIPEQVQDQFLRMAYSDAYMVKRVEQTVCVVAEMDKQVVGFANASQKEDKADLHAIYLLPSAKGNGIGTRLLHALLEEMTGIKQLYVEVEKGNASGEQFYNAKGFTVVNEYEDELFGHKLQTKQLVLHC